MRFKKWPSLEALEKATASESALSGSETDHVDLLPLARRNGVRRVVRGLTEFEATLTPVEPGPRRRRLLSPGYLIDVETAGRELDLDERRTLLDFADAYFSGEA